MNLPVMQQSPWQRGHDDGMQGKPAPGFPKADSTWTERLYAAGWNSGTRDRLAASPKPIPLPSTA